MILSSPQLTETKTSIPRESGDDPPQGLIDKGSEGVFPARAGMIRDKRQNQHLLLCIPRESGDDPLFPYEVNNSPQYSPRERG